MTHKEEVQKLVSRHQRRLQKLQEKKASYGGDAPPHLLLEIEDLLAELKALKAKLASAEDGAALNKDEIGNQPGAAGRAGDQFSNDFQGAMLNVRSQLIRVKENIRLMPHLAEADKNELVRLVNELKQQLEQVLPERAGEAEKVARRVEVMITELAEEEPDVEMVETMGKTLRRAAENLAEFAPSISRSAHQIVTYALRLVR